MSTVLRATLTKIELNELIRTHSLPVILAKKLAQFLSVLMILITLTALFSSAFLLLNAATSFKLFDGKAPLSIFMSLLGAGFALSVIPGLFTYFTLPGIQDRDLKIMESLPVTPESEPAVRDVNRKLSELNKELHGWHESGLIRKHADVFATTEISSNVVTYGNLDRARVVFAVDVLESMSFPQLRAILAHETGHIVENDYIILCLFGQITRILDLLRWPFKALGWLITLIFSQFERIPLQFIRSLARGLSFLLRLALKLVSLPLWLPRALLYWEAQLAEYLADDFGVALGGSASGLITALMQLEDMKLTAPRSGQKRRYDLFATVVRHSRRRETNSALADLIQFLGELESSHPDSVTRWRRMGHLGFQDERIK